MNEFSHKSWATFLLLATALFLTACAATPPQEEIAPAEQEAVIEIEPWDGDGMDIPLDGSSMEAWKRSMARVKAHTSESQYTTLENAIDYLLTYDLATQRDMNKLIRKLDGMTGFEVLYRVGWRKPAPGKGPAEKGAADAKII